MRTRVEHLKEIICLLFIRLFHCFPIKDNKVFLFSYYGSQYGCSPKYITEYILKHQSENSFELVWAFNNVDAQRHLKGIRKVRTMSIRYFYDLCTARIIITNARTTDWFVKRKGQYYIQTWHSSLRLKQIEQDAEHALPPHYIEMAKKDSAKCDLLLSGCEFSTELFKRAFWYQGEILKSGIPRNDMLFFDHRQDRQALLEKLGIPMDHKTVLYAPTFRKDHGIQVYDLDYQAVLDRLHRRFGGQWTFLIRLHPLLMNQAHLIPEEPSLVNVTLYDDVQELLSISDVLITDYSSIMFDYALTANPCFLYLPDVDDYLKHDRKLYFEIAELPFVSSISNKELLRAIETFDESGYRSRIASFQQAIGSYENGTASAQVVRRMEKICFSKQARSVVYEKI